jgi:hypothetical protein
LNIGFPFGYLHSHFEMVLSKLDNAY